MRAKILQNENHSLQSVSVPCSENIVSPDHERSVLVSSIHPEFSSPIPPRETQQQQRISSSLESASFRPSFTGGSLLGTSIHNSESIIQGHPNSFASVQNQS